MKLTGQKLRIVEVLRFAKKDRGKPLVIRVKGDAIRGPAGSVCSDYLYRIEHVGNYKGRISELRLDFGFDIKTHMVHYRNASGEQRSMACYELISEPEE